MCRRVRSIYRPVYDSDAVTILIIVEYTSVVGFSIFFSVAIARLTLLINAGGNSPA